ncbi:MAG: L-lysine 6-transaminase [Planctomycetota bacterium]|nr:L-lysine 6-transaminase [Planctomycetota bacterium]
MTQIDAKQVHSVLGRHQLADGYSFVLDLERSHGSWLVDGVTGKEYLDMFTCFASWPIGYNHPMMREEAFSKRLLTAAENNPANSDLYTGMMAEFVEAFATKVTPEGYDHHFWVAGGSLAVENAMKAAFDWKAHKLGLKEDGEEVDLVVLHFKQAFHGRSGYTMSVTNTDPNKVALFPKFQWPRVSNPYCEFDNDGNISNDVAAAEAVTMAEIDAAFECYADRIACILIEPMQGEGGDRHFRAEFLRELRRVADEREAMLIFDEVQTGFYGSGKPWLWQHLGVAPDIVCFSKKSQVGGIYANSRIDEVEDNVFAKSSRINSTWGGNLVDMVRCQRFIEIIEQEQLADNIHARGEQLLKGLRSIAKDTNAFSDVRGIGSLIAFTMETGELRDKAVAAFQERGVLALTSGEDSVRFRMPLVITAAEVDGALERIADAL